MANNKEIISKLANVPLSRPGFDALGISATVLVQMNPDGKWEKCAPDNIDEERLKTVVQHLLNSNAVSAAQSFCCQCAAENMKAGTKANNYVPVIMMPIYSANQCPFDIKCEIEKNEDSQTKPTKKGKDIVQGKDSEKEKTKRKAKKRGFVMQRLTDFDLLSQW